MKKAAIVLTLLLFLSACSQAGGSRCYYVEPLEGEDISPDNRFHAIGLIEGPGDYKPGETYAPDVIQISTLETDVLLWKGDAGLRNAILWSPEGGYAALARTWRTWSSVTVIETENWTEWEFTLPDGSPIPEYTFFPYNEPWAMWRSEGSLDLTVGRGGDAGEQKHYTCAVSTNDGKLKGIVWEERREFLPGSYDFDHDGEPEILELVTVYGDETLNQVGWYEVRVHTEDNGLCWSQSASESHPGWISYFACRVDGEDYLLRYTPTMYQGYAAYAYQLFSLDKAGKELVIQEGDVSFDMNFGEFHERFEPGDIAAFLKEVHELLEDSELLLTTENGEFRSGGPGAEFKDDLDGWTNDDLYDDSKSLEENIRTIGDYWIEQRAG